MYVCLRINNKNMRIVIVLFSAAPISHGIVIIVIVGSTWTIFEFQFRNYVFTYVPVSPSPSRGRLMCASLKKNRYKHIYKLCHPSFSLCLWCRRRHLVIFIVCGGDYRATCVTISTTFAANRTLTRNQMHTFSFNVIPHILLCHLRKMGT